MIWLQHERKDEPLGGMVPFSGGYFVQGTGEGFAPSYACSIDLHNTNHLHQDINEVGFSVQARGRVCPYCQRLNPDDFESCRGCGAPPMATTNKPSSYWPAYGFRS